MILQNLKVPPLLYRKPLEKNILQKIMKNGMILITTQLAETPYNRAMNILYTLFALLNFCLYLVSLYVFCLFLLI